MEIRKTPVQQKVLILFYHPRFENSRANRTLTEALRTHTEFSFRDVYELYPDFNIDIKAEQEQLLQHDIIVWMHPFYWYSCPPLMKQWIDLVLAFRWAYGPGGEALKGKKIMNAITSGGGFDAYQHGGRNRFTYREYLIPFDQTATLCHMQYLPPFIVPGAPRLDTGDLETYANQLINTLKLLASGSISNEILQQHDYLNSLISTN